MSNFQISGTPARTAVAPLTPQEQSTLAERLRCGEPSAEEELVRLFADRVRLFAQTRIRDRELARDLTQDVLLAVVTATREGRLRDGERLAAFVYGIARNLVNNYLRGRCRLPREDPIDAALDLASVSHQVEDTERAALVSRALIGVDALDRTILLLTLVKGLKPGEIASRLALTSEIVRARKSRALKKIVERVQRLSRT